MTVEMARPILPYEPTHVLKPSGPDLWIADGGVVLMRLPVGSIPFTTRMAIARLPDGGLWAWSPVEPEPRLLEAIDALGPVAHIVSPNALHYANVPAWSERYPRARVWASPGVRRRAASQGIDVRFTDDLGDEAPLPWRGAINQAIFRGSRLVEEVAFHHRRSRTLILADMIQAHEPEQVPAPWLRALMRLVGTLHPDGRTPYDLRATFFGRRARGQEALRAIRSWRPDGLVLAHGRCMGADAMPEIERALAWLDR